MYVRDLSLKTSVRQLVVMADTREGHIQGGADVPTVRGETGLSL